MSVPDTQDNRLLTAPVARVFMAQAVPLVLVMLMSGLQNIVDAMFLGHFIGTDALAAVSVIFPVLMTIIALSVLVHALLILGVGFAVKGDIGHRG